MKYTPCRNSRFCAASALPIFISYLSSPMRACAKPQAGVSPPRRSPPCTYLFIFHFFHFFSFFVHKGSSTTVAPAQPTAIQHNTTITTAAGTYSSTSVSTRDRQASTHERASQVLPRASHVRLLFDVYFFPHSFFVVPSSFIPGST